MTELRNFKLQDNSQVRLIGEISNSLVSLELNLEFGLLIIWTKPGYTTALSKFLVLAKSFNSYLKLFNALEDVVCNFAAILVMSGKIVLTRDIMGSIPLFYSRTEREIAVSVSLEDIRQYLGINDISRVYLEVFLASNFASSPQWEITPWKGIFRVRPSYVYSLNQKGTHSEKYAVIPEVHFNSNIDDLGVRLEIELAIASPESTVTGILLSGGFDSSLLLSIARLKSKQLYALHHVARSEDRNIDTIFAELAVEFMGKDVQMNNLPVSDCWDYKNFLQYSNNYDEPNVGIAGGQLETYRVLHLKALGVNTLINGIGGDAFRSDLSFLGDLYRTRRYFSLFYQLWRLSEFMQINKSDWDLKQDYDQDIFQEANYLRLSDKIQCVTMVGWLQDEIPSTRKSVYKQMLYSHPAFSLEQAILWKHGVSQYYPFLTRKALEIALAIPPELLIDKKYGTRAFFKRCFTHHYHPEMLKRNGKNSWGTYHSIGLAREYKNLRLLFDNSQLADYGLLEPQKFRNVLENRYQRGETLNFVEERVVALEIWLQTRKNM